MNRSGEDSEAFQDTVYCFLDTNVFLHFPRFDQVDWKRHLRAQEVVIIVDSVVFHELDKHKVGSNDGRRDRARSVLQLLKQVLERNKGSSANQVRDGVLLQTLMRSPKIDWDDVGLDPHVQDDRLVASVLRFKQDHPTAKVLLLANDFGPLLKAEEHEIPAKDPEDFLERQELSSPLDKEMKRLKQQVAEFQSRVPRLSLGRRNGETLERMIRLPRPQNLPSMKKHGEIVSLVEEERRATLATADPQLKSFNGKYRDFCKQVEYYVDEFRGYLERENIVQSGWPFVLEFTIMNEGKAPATGVDATISIDQGIVLCLESNSKYWKSEYVGLKEPVRPVPPKVPTIAEQLASVTGMIGLQNYLAPYDMIVPPGLISNAPQLVEKPRTVVENGIVYLNVPPLKAGNSWTCDPIFMILMPMDANACTVPFTLHANELSGQISGELTLVFE
jgi:rRNA-processing protein FCF1